MLFDRTKHPIYAQGRSEPWTMRNGGGHGWAAGIERLFEEGSEYRIFTPSESIRINILRDAGRPAKPTKNEARWCRCGVNGGESRSLVRYSLLSASPSIALSRYRLKWIEWKPNKGSSVNKTGSETAGSANLVSEKGYHHSRKLYSHFKRHGFIHERHI